MSEVTADSADSYNPFRNGERLAGKYELIERLGAGGLGCVFAARHLGFDSQVALKFLHPEYASEPDVLACFKREARAGFQIDSKHVVRVIDLEELADGTPFIVMERLYGQDLQRVLASSGRLQVQRACDYVLQVCKGLRAAHALGIIHRDIKPGNLFLVSSDHDRELDEHVKLLDFGISKLCTGTHLVQTAQTSQVAIGTPEYMSPEQVRGAPDLDTRSDIWSLGCVLYELLTGVAPFRRPTIVHSCAAVLEDEPVAPVTLVADLPAGLSALVMRCLAKEPKRRPQTVEALAEALESFSVAGRRLQLTAATSSGPTEPRVRHRPARRWLLALSGALALGAAVSLLWEEPAPRRVAALSIGASAVRSPVAAAPLLEAPPPSSELAPTAPEPRVPRNHVKPRRPKPQPESAVTPKLAPRPEPDVGF